MIAFWNCEGISRNQIAIQCILCSTDIICLSELNEADSTINIVLKESKGIHFCCSDDVENNLGRSAILWKDFLDPYITQFPCQSNSISCIKIMVDSNYPIFIVSLYMPTAGKDSLYVDTLAELTNLISDIYEKFIDPVILIGGDLNNSLKNKSRFSLWNHFISQYQISQINVQKPTYHHHIGDGIFDSFLDSALLINPPPNVSLSLSHQLCPLIYDILDSKHDTLIVRLQVPILQKPIPEVSRAPTIDFIPIRIKWTQNGIIDFSNKVSPILDQLVANYSISSSKALFDIFFQSVNKTLIAYATATNKSISLPPPLLNHLNVPS